MASVSKPTGFSLQGWTAVLHYLFEDFLKKLLLLDDIHSPSVSLDFVHVVSSEPQGKHGKVTGKWIIRSFEQASRIPETSSGMLCGTFSRRCTEVLNLTIVGCWVISAVLLSHSFGEKKTTVKTSNPPPLHPAPSTETHTEI